MTPLEITVPDTNDTLIDVFVEVPMGSRNKYEFDKELGRFRLDRMLFSAVHYPGDYGYIDHTLAEDGDALDAMVILGAPTFPGCVITARVVGVMHMTDEQGPDAKIVGVPVDDPRWTHIVRLEDVPDHLTEEILHFFSIYKDLEDKKVSVEGWGGREEALDVVRESRERYQDEQAGG
jgi:inorganic pyrophosphatase